MLDWVTAASAPSAQASPRPRGLLRANRTTDSLWAQTGVSEPRGIAVATQGGPGNSGFRGRFVFRFAPAQAGTATLVGRRTGSAQGGIGLCLKTRKPKSEIRNKSEVRKINIPAAQRLVSDLPFRALSLFRISRFGF